MRDLTGTINQHFNFDAVYLSRNSSVDQAPVHVGQRGVGRRAVLARAKSDSAHC